MICIISSFYKRKFNKFSVDFLDIFQTKEQIFFSRCPAVQKGTATTTTTPATNADATPAFQVNQKKLKELAESANAIKIGGKVRRRSKKRFAQRSF